jgi:hypothetical protein
MVRDWHLFNISQCNVMSYESPAMQDPKASNADTWPLLFLSICASTRLQFIAAIATTRPVSG